MADAAATGEESGESLASSHGRAVVEALFVTLLWSSSYVLIKEGLATIPALTFAGLRYGVAAVVLVALFAARRDPGVLTGLSRREWSRLLGLGVLLYAVTQGAQFVALQYLRAVTVSVALTFTPAVVALLAVPVLGEPPNRRQVGGLVVVFAGVAAYFYPISPPRATVIGLGVMALGLAGNSLASVLGRRLNRDRSLSSLGVTAVSMTVGASLLFGTGIAIQGLPPLGLRSWAIVGWLALVNTAFAFTLWNRTLQTLTAVQSSVINNTMLVQVAVLGWLFLGEPLTVLELVGLGLVGTGALVVQVARR